MEALDSVKIDTALAAQAQREVEEDASGRMDFLTMLVAQLENQDPLNPQDSADFAAQLAQFSSVEQLVAMRAGIDALVAASKAEGDAGAAPAASTLDAASLVGRDVTVFGSQLEVDASGSPTSMNFRSIDNAIDARVIVTNQEGRVVLEESILPLTADGEETYLRPGDHVYRLDPREHYLPEGVYGIEFVARGVGGENVTLLPMVEGRVTGAILAGEPAIRIGSRIFPVADVLEVRLSETEIANGGSSVGGAPGIGGGQSVFRAQPSATPRPFGS